MQLYNQEKYPLKIVRTDKINEILDVLKAEGLYDIKDSQENF